MTVLLVLPYLAEDALDIFAIWSDGNSLAQVARCRLFAIHCQSISNLRPACLAGGRYQKLTHLLVARIDELDCFPG